MAIFDKCIARCGMFQNDNGTFVITKDQLQRWTETFYKMLNDGVNCPLVKDHKEEVDSAVGRVVGMRVDGNDLIATIDVPRDEDAQLLINNDVSIKAQSSYQTGVADYEDAIRHVSLTPMPLLTKLGGFRYVGNAPKQQYELVCSISKIEEPTPEIETKTTSKTDNNSRKVMQMLEKIVKILADALGVGLPSEDVLNDEKLLTEWLQDALVKKDDKEEKSDAEENAENIEASDADLKDEKKDCKGKKKKCAVKKNAPEDLEAETPEGNAPEDLEAGNPEDEETPEEVEEESDVPEPEPETEPEPQEEKAPEQEGEPTQPDPEQAKKEKEEKEAEDKKKSKATVKKTEKIKGEKELAEQAKNIVASINTSRRNQLKSFIGRNGITAERINGYIDKYAKNDSLDITCSLQGEYDALIDGLSAVNASVVTMTHCTSTPQTSDDGPGMRAWKEKMEKRRPQK